MAPIITVENISKKYTIRHDVPRGGQNFRELLMSPFRRKTAEEQGGIGSPLEHAVRESIFRNCAILSIVRKFPIS